MSTPIAHDLASPPTSPEHRALALALHLCPAPVAHLVHTAPGAPPRTWHSVAAAELPTALLRTPPWDEQLGPERCVVIADTARDPRLSARLHQGEAGQIRSCVRLAAPLGRAGGTLTLWLLDARPREFAAHELEALADLLGLLAAAHEAAALAPQLYADVSIARLHAALHNATDLVSINDAQGVVQYVSPSVTRILGYQPSDLIGRNSFELLHPDDLAAIGERFRRAVLSPGPSPSVKMRFRDVKGEWRTLEATSTNMLDDSHVRGIVVNARDITDQVQAELAREASERQIRFQASALDQMSDSVVAIDEQRRVIYLNPAAERQYGRTLAEARGLPLSELYEVVYDRPGEEQRALQAMVTAGFWRGECHHVFAGKSIAVELSVAALHEATLGSCMIAVVRDITARKEVEERLRLLESVVVHANDAVLITEADLLEQPGPRIRYVNAAFSKITGYSAEEVLGRSPRFLQGPETAAQTTAQIRAALEQRLPVRVEIRNYTKAGQPIWLDLSITPVGGPDGAVTHFVAIQRDITDRKELEAQLLQSQKLESIGRLAGGIAHDFNNLLTAIGGYADLALESVAEPVVREDIAEIRRAVDRAAALTRQLLTFSRRNPHSPQVLPLNQIVGQIENLLRRLLGPTIDLRTALTSAPSFVAADPIQIEQVLVNLAINARDAMPHGGSLLIETALVVPEPGDGAPRPTVCLVVRDTGSGMSAETQAHLFEPFFTTKAPGQGTGLGLATCYGIVQQHGGQIRIVSAPGAGTTVTVSLPACDTPYGGQATAGQLQAARPGEGLVLVVDDEAGISALMRRVLEMAGYRVLLAANGAEAIALLDAGAAREVRLVVTDVLMPVVDGRELGRWVQANKPGLPVLYMSGHALFAGAADDEPPLSPLLPKPFVAGELLEAVRGALSS